MKHFSRNLPVVFILFLIIVLSGCGGTTPAAAPEPTAIIPVTAKTESPMVEESPAVEPTVDPEFALPDVSLASFHDSTNIDNKYFPLTPGTHFVYDGFTEEAARQIPHRIEFIVTDLIKDVQGVKTVVAYILDYSDGELVEAEVAFYAQDNEGTVWFFGEHPEVYEDGKMVEAPTWIPGYKGAQAGMVMKAKPELNLPSYAQGWGPAVNWTDRGRVVKMGEQTCVPADCYEDVLVTEEFSQSEPDAFQVKYYAPGVGNVKVGWRGEDATHEELELTEYKQLSPEALAEFRDAALALEAHAYEISKEVYALTAPFEVRSP